MLFDNIEDGNVMMKSWFGLEDFDTYFYKSTPDLGSPYDLSVHHSHRYLYFSGEEINSYIGAGLIQCLTKYKTPLKTTIELDDSLTEIGKVLSKIKRHSQRKKKQNSEDEAAAYTSSLTELNDSLTELDNFLSELETDIEEPKEVEFMWGELITFKGIKALLVDGFEVFEGDSTNKLLKYKIIDVSQHPLYSNNIRHNEYMTIQDNDTVRASKATRYYGDRLSGTGKAILPQFKEKEAIDLIKNSLLKSEKPVVSCSFGKDSLVILSLTLEACDQLNIPREKLNVFYSDTLNEFDEVRKLSKKLQKDWGFNLITGHPEKTLKTIIREHGGMDESYFWAKGTRKKDNKGNGVMPLSEKCCKHLKHDTFYKISEEHCFDLNIVGTRTDESRQRRLAGLRDGERFYWQMGKMMKLQPILHWTEKEVFAYIQKHRIPLPSIYNQNLILKDSRGKDRNIFTLSILDKHNITDNIITDPLVALELKEQGMQIFMPRVGCLLCPIPIKHGYLRWLREFYPKVFKGMLSRMGYAQQLVKLIPEKTKEELSLMLGKPITTLTIMEQPEIIEDILDYMPCAFDVLE